MKILVCIKQVPEAAGAGTAPESGKLSRTMNLADKAALEAALSLRDDFGGSADVLSMGVPSAEAMLRELLQLGINRAALATDPAFAGSDTLATARVISSAAKYLGGYDLILTGRRASDGETGHTGPETAAMLGFRCVTDVISLQKSENGLLCERLLEDKNMTLYVPMPAVVTVSGGYLLRPPSIAGIREARGKKVELLTAAMLGIPPELAGTGGSATQVRRVWPAKAPLRHCRIYRDISEGADAVIEFLQKDRVREVSKRVTPEAPADGTAVVVSLSSDALSQRCAPELMTAAKSVCRNAAFVLLEDAGGDDVTAAAALCTYIAAEKPDCVLFPATVHCRAIAPLCAAQLGIGLAADCTGLAPDGAGDMSMIRPTFGGSVMAEVICRTKPAMASVRPGVFEPDADMPEPVRINVPEGGAKVISERAAEVSALDIGVKIIVSGGRGVGKKENFEKLAALAAKLGGVLTGSRQAVDGGFLPYPRQVGQTGTAVRPDFYIACGISGTVQHMEGVRAGSVIAVNTDPKARIFDYAEIGIIGDCMEFADILAKKLSAGG